MKIQIFLTFLDDVWKNYFFKKISKCYDQYVFFFILIIIFVFFVFSNSVITHNNALKYRKSWIIGGPDRGWTAMDIPSDVITDPITY